MTTPTPTTMKLARDQRGAVMLTGVFMACFLIGCLWFLIGIGDAIVFRDRMQEVADHSVYSAAVVHARGMNLIAALNLVMYAITAIWVLLNIFDDLLDVAHDVLQALSALPYVGSVFTALDKVDQALDVVVEAAIKVWEVGPVKIGLPACATIQSAAAIGYPWYAEYASISIGRDYKQTALSVSPSMFPGDIGGAVSKYIPGFGGGGAGAGGRAGSMGSSGGGGGGDSGSKLGLPVIKKKMDTLCDIVAGSAISKFMPSGVGAFLSWGGSGGGGSSIKDEYCTGEPWSNENGPKAMWPKAKNGSDWMQVWGLVLNPKYREAAEKQINVAAYKFVRGQPHVPTRSFFAQAEFYFDCDGKWKDDDCNGSNDDYDNALYEMKWRARLRRVRTPKIANMLGSYALDLILSPTLADWAKGTTEDKKRAVSSVTDMGKREAGEQLFSWGKSNSKSSSSSSSSSSGRKSSSSVIH